ncbi:MAG UNVERIFIED_CONTAM: hypothetical protein LVR29_23815 [Microcystis novacekii LVE1205-3]
MGLDTGLDGHFDIESRFQDNCNGQREVPVAGAVVQVGLPAQAGFDAGGWN